MFICMKKTREKRKANIGNKMFAIQKCRPKEASDMASIRINFDDKCEEKNVKHADYKAQIATLAEKDPDFFKFLNEQEADLLHFNESDGEISQTSTEQQEDVRIPDSTCERPKINRNGLGRCTVTSAFIDELEENLNQTKPSVPLIRTTVEVFMACASRVGAEIDAPRYIIDSEKSFERVVLLCFHKINKLLYSLLKNGRIKNMNDLAQVNCDDIKKMCARERFSGWKRYRGLVKQYLGALVLFLNELQTSNVLLCTLKTIIEIIELYVHFNGLARNLIKSLVKIWSRKSYECRCAAFTALRKFIRENKSFHSKIMKACYFAYVSNAREVSLESWQLIVFMQKSLAEICAIDFQLSYQYAFVYIRQIAIHLRNATIAGRKDLVKTVYNWQFILCLYLWARVISRAARSAIRSPQDGQLMKNKNCLFELAYPLCQITIATLKLYPSPKYLPLKLHCIHILLIMQNGCKIYIPTLSLATQLMDDVVLMLNKRPKKGRGLIKAIDLKYIIKASSSHIEEAGYEQVALDSLFRILLKSAYIIRSNCAFADLIVPLDFRLKIFSGNYRYYEHAKLFRTLSAKLKDHGKRVKMILASADLHLTDSSGISLLEHRLEAADMPLVAFYNSWLNTWKMQEEAKMMAIMNPTFSQSRESSELKGKRKLSDDKSIGNHFGKKFREYSKDENVRCIGRMIQKRSECVVDDSIFEDKLEDLILSESDDSDF